MNYTIQAATEYGIGTGPNGTGKRAKVSGFYVISPRGRRIRAFTGGKNAETQAKEWALRCDEFAAEGNPAFANQ
jgi:hypothetical protein